VNKDARLTMRVPARLLKEAKAVAKRRKMTLSNFVQKLVEDAVAAEQVMKTTIDAEQI
jgi:predicted DNA binding CopG/RHH family protein